MQFSKASLNDTCFINNNKKLKKSSSLSCKHQMKTVISPKSYFFKVASYFENDKSGK